MGQRMRANGPVQPPCPTTRVCYTGRSVVAVKVFAMPAPVIDLEEYRRRRAQRTSPSMAPMPMSYVQWVPVVFWVPVWSM